MSLASVVGQDAAIATLRRALLHDSVPQGYLWVGSEGVGKMTTAIEFAKAACCKSPLPNGDSCDVCINCTRIQEGTHPDVARVAPDGEFTRIWQLWSRPGHPPGALETLPFAPVAAPKRFYLFERADTFNEESANSLLKALEEPPFYAYFVLCAPSPTSVLPTILSRCQMIRFHQASAETIAMALREKRGLGSEEARTLAAYSQGALGRALRLADTPDAREQRDQLLELAERIAHSPPIAGLKLAEELRNLSKPPKAKKGDDEGEAEKSTRGEMGRALDVLCAWYGDLLAVTLQGAAASVIHVERRDALAKAAARYAPEQIAANLETLFKFRRHLARNANAQLATEVLMLRLIPTAAPTRA